MSEEEGAATNGETEAAQITVRVRDQTGEETTFKIKKTTRMEKIFSAYAKRKGVAVEALRFMLDGERVDKNDTAKMLELEDEDQIDCFLEQQGGIFVR